MRKIRYALYGGLVYIGHVIGGIPGAVLSVIGIKTWHAICKDPEAIKDEIIIDI